MITSHKVGGIGQPTKFEFQYLPRLGMLTELGNAEDPAADTELTTQDVKRPTWAVLLVGAVVGSVAVASFLGVGVAGWLRRVPLHLL